jgi:excisionase family DNA binding protein
MFSTQNLTSAYTPEQVAKMLQLSKNTVYQLISRGDIVAKKIGKLYRIPAASISFFLTGLDYDLYQADLRDRQNIKQVTDLLKQARSSL